MIEITQRRCPICGARLTIVRSDHHLAGNEKLVCPQHGTVGRMDDGRLGVYGRHRDSLDEDDD